MKKVIDDKMMFITFLACLLFFFAGWIIIPISESKEIKEMIAAKYEVEYNSFWELNSKVKFYEYQAAYLGDKSGFFYVINGEEIYGDDNEINTAIASYVDSWC